MNNNTNKSFPYSDVPQRNDVTFGVAPNQGACSCPIGYQNNVSPQFFPGYQNGIWQQTQPIMPEQFALSRDTAEYLYKQRVISESNAQIEMAKQELNHQHKMKEETYRAYLAEKRDEANFRRKMNSENAVTTIFEDSGGYLCIQIKYPDGTSNFSQPIFKHANIHFARMIAKKEEEALDVFSWMECNEEKKIILKGDKRNPRNLMKEMEKHGNPILVGRDRKKQIADLVYSFLVAHGNTVRVPEHYGWNKEGDRWIFIHEMEITIERYEKGERN